MESEVVQSLLVTYLEGLLVAVATALGW